MIDQREIIWGVIAPPVLMALGMVATATVPVLKRYFSTGALLAVVFGICHLGFRGWASPLHDVQNWPGWIAFAGGLITWCSVCGHGPLLWRVAVRLALTAVAVWLLLKPQIDDGRIDAPVLWIGGLSLVWTMVILAWERAHAATTPGVSVTTLTVLAGFSAAALLFFNCITHAQFAGILTAALTAALVLGWKFPTWYTASGPVTVVAIVLPMLWLLGNRYADLPTWALPLLVLAGMTPLVTTFAPIRQWADWKRLACATLVAAVLVSPVLAWGVITSIRASAEQSHGY